MLANINMLTSCGPQGHQEGDGSGFFFVYFQKKRKAAIDRFGLRNLPAVLLTHKMRWYLHRCVRSVDRNMLTLTLFSRFRPVLRNVRLALALIVKPVL